MTTAKAAAAQLNAAYAGSTPGTAPTTGWQQLMPNPTGIQNFHPQYVDVQANPLDPSMVQQRGAHVGQDAAPTIVADLSLEVLHTFIYGLLRSAPKAPWSAATHVLRPTAAVDGGGSADSFTVAGAPTLPAGTLILVQGMATAANNGIFKLEAGSNATTLNVPTATLVAETVAPTGSACITVIGFQFATGDLDINADGDLVTSSQDLTVFGLQPGHRVYFRASDHVTSFATGTLSEGMHYATIEATVTTNLMQLKHRARWHDEAVGSWPIGAVANTDRKVRMYFGTLVRNVPDGHSDYLDEPAWWLELRDTGVGAANAAVFSYAESCVLNSLSLAMGTDAKIEATLAFLARRVVGHLEAADRYSGASSAFRPLLTNLFHTACASLLVHRILDASDDSNLIAEVTDATFGIAHNATARKQLAGCGSAGAMFGDIVPSLTTSTYFERAAVPRAIDDETTVRYEMLAFNAQGGIAIDLPTGRLNGGSKTYAENSPVMMDVDFLPHGDPANSNIVCCINVLGYLPTEDPGAGVS